MKEIDTVICVHGFWSHGAGMLLIKRRLEKEHGLRVLNFSYPSVTGTLDDNASALAQFIREQKLEGTHIVGHSLGGVVTLRMFANGAATIPGRIVCLASPLSGSRAADFLDRHDWAAPILGHSLLAGVVREAANEWATQVCVTREVGIIAGNLPLGFGHLIAKFDEPNDGTVAVSETQLDGATDHLTVGVTHNGMLVSSRVADQAAAFLKRGEFLRDD